MVMIKVYLSFISKKLSKKKKTCNQIQLDIICQRTVNIINCAQKSSSLIPKTNS